MSGPRLCSTAGVAVIALLLSGLMSYAQEYPARNVTVIVPFPAGGGGDLFARIIGQQLAGIFGKPFVVDNRSGASGNIGADVVAHSAPDGHTLLYTVSSIALSTALYTRLSFDVEKDLRAVSMTVTIPQILTVHPSLPARTVGELVSIAKAKPNSIVYTGGTPGSAGNFTMEILSLNTGARLYHVPYKGAAPALTALRSGEVQAAFLVIPLVAPQLQGGKLRAIGISSAKRSSMLPDIPTIQEQGIAGFEVLQWHGFFVPVRTPANIVDRLHTAITKAVNGPVVRERAAAEGSDVVGSSPQQFAAFLRSEIVKYKDVAKRAGMKLEE